MADNNKIGPVEIEYTIPDSVAQDFDNFVKTVDKIGDAGESSAKKLKDGIAQQRAVIAQITADIDNIQKKAAQAAPGKIKYELEAEAKAAKQALLEEKAALDELEKSVKQTEVKHVGLRQELRNIRQTMGELQLAGKELSPEYDALAKRAGDLNDALRDQVQRTNTLANDERGFQGVISTVNGLAGAMSAGVGIMSLFGSESEDLQKIQARLQSVMAISIGLQQVAQTLNKDSAFRIVVVSGVTNAWSTAQTYLNTQLGISIGLSRAFLLTGIGAIIAGVGLAIAAYSRWSDAQEKIAVEEKKFIEKTAENLGKSKAVVEELSNEWSKLGGNLEEKKKFVDANKDAFHELGVEVNNVADAENVLVNNKKAFLEAIMAKAKAAAAMEIAAEKYKEGMKKMMEADKLPNTVTVRSVQPGQGQFGGAYTNTEVKNSTKVDMQSEANTLIKSGDDFINQSIIQKNKASELLGAADIKQYEKEDKNSKTVYDAAKELQRQLLDIRAQTAALQIQQQEDGLARRLAQLDNEKVQEIRKIKEKNADIVKAYNESKGLTGTSAVTDISQIDPAAAKQQADAIEQLNKAYESAKVEETRKANAEVESILKEVTDRNKKELDKQLADIDKFYDKVIADAKKAGQDVSKTANEARNREKTVATIKSDMEELNNAAIIEQRKLEIKKRYALVKGLEDVHSAEKNKALVLAQIEYLKKLDAAGEDVTDALKAKNLELEESSIKVKDAYGATIKELSGYASQLGQALGSVSPEAEKALTEIGKVGDAVGRIASGDYIGGGIALLGEALKLFSKGDSEAAKYQKEQLAQMSKLYEQLNETIKRLEKSLDLALGETKMDSYRKNIFNLVNSSDQSFSKLNNLLDHYLDYNSNGRSSVFDFIKKGVEGLRQSEEKINSLLGQDYGKRYSSFLRGDSSSESIDKFNAAIQENLSNLYILQNLSDKLTESEKQALKDTISEQETLAEKGIQYATAYKEALTGSTSQSITDSIVEGFKNGYDSVADFADNFQKMMQDAIYQALKVKALEKPLADWYDNFARANESDGVLTKAEISALKEAYDKIIADAQAQFDAMKATSGVDFGTDAQRAGLSGSVAQASQESIDILSGRILGMQALLTDLRNYAKDDALFYKSVYAIFVQIADNTSYCRLLEQMNNRQADWDSRGIKIKMS